MASRFLQAWRAAVLAVGLASAGLAGAAADYYLQIDGIKGGSVDRGHEGWIAIDSFSWGLTMVTSNAGGGSGAGKASFADLVWAQPVDISTPAWFLNVATGKHIREATLDVVRAGEQQGSFFQMIFKSTVGTGLQVMGSGDAPYATASMSSGSSVTLRYRPQDDRGGLGPWVEGRFDLATGSSQALFSGDEAVLQGLFASGGTINFDAGAVVAVPEPTSALMLLGGLVALGAFRARQRRG